MLVPDLKRRYQSSFKDGNCDNQPWRPLNFACTLGVLNLKFNEHKISAGFKDILY